MVIFGDSNTWGYDGKNLKRYEPEERWTWQLQQRLGDDWLLAVNGVPGRTAVFTDPLNEALNGLEHLPAVLLAHYPMDLLVIMLGTNDCKARFAATPFNIGAGMRRLVNKAKSMDVWKDKPNILIVAPILMDKRLYDVPSVADGMGPGCVEKSHAVPAIFQQIAQETGCHYMDCNPYVKPIPGDWMHFDQGSATPFAQAMEDKLRELLG